jgi:hypothetical protein
VQLRSTDSCEISQFAFLCKNGFIVYDVHLVTKEIYGVLFWHYRIISSYIRPVDNGVS